MAGAIAAVGGGGAPLAATIAGGSGYLLAVLFVELVVTPGDLAESVRMLRRRIGQTTSP